MSHALRLLRGRICGYSPGMTSAIALLVATAASLSLALLAGLLLRPARTK